MSGVTPKPLKDDAWSQAWNNAWIPVGSVRKPPIGRNIIVMHAGNTDKGVLIPQNIFWAIYRGVRITPQQDNALAITQEIWQTPKETPTITHWLNNAESESDT